MMIFSLKLVLGISADIRGAPLISITRGFLAGLIEGTPPCWCPLRLTHIPQGEALLSAFQGKARAAAPERQAWRRN